MKTSGEHLLLVAHLFDPDHSMESRLSWFRAMEAAGRYRVTVVCADARQAVIDQFQKYAPRSQVLVVRHTALEEFLIRWGVFYLAYRRWHCRVFHAVSEMHQLKPFTLVHQVSYCGYREPGECWKLGAPFFWGPVGGSHNLPWRFLPSLGIVGALRESLRSVINTFQLRYSRKVTQALQASAIVLAANKELQEDFQRIHGVKLGVLLETGIEAVSTQKKPLRNPESALRILWAGRLESWKALPLLLEALAHIKDRVPFELRILGDGSLARNWRLKSNALGLDQHVQWVGWPTYTQRREHYEWADVFAFTSLRDTSGTGLLESLAEGVPIIGLDHQGARDIMTPECCVPISVTSPRKVVVQFAEAITVLAGDPHRLKQLSDQALIRAENYLWSANGAALLKTYAAVLNEPDSQDLPRKVLDLESVETEDSEDRFSVAAG